MVFGVGFSEYCDLAAGCCAETLAASSSRVRAKRAAPRGMECSCRELVFKNRGGPPSPHFPDLRILKDFWENENGSAHSKRVRGSIFGSAHSKGVSALGELLHKELYHVIMICQGFSGVARLIVW